MRDFYTRYYNAVQTSRAHAGFCERAYGKDLAQHGFTDMDALALLVDVTKLRAGQRALDIGCGNGGIAGHISGATGACVVGLDYIPAALEDAHRRTRAQSPLLQFTAGDLMQLPFAPASFDLLLSLDTLYFSDDYPQTLAGWVNRLRPGGALAIFYSHGANPQNPAATFDRATLAPHKTPLGLALQALELPFRSWDFTAQDYALAQRKRAALIELRAAFAAEGNTFLYENRWGETCGVMAAFEAGMHSRYLYLVTPD